MRGAFGIILVRAGRLAGIATSGSGRWSAFALLILVLALGFLGVWLSVRMIAWNKAFYDALENMDGAEALRQIGVFFAIVGAFSVSSCGRAGHG